MGAVGTVFRQSLPGLMAVLIGHAAPAADADGATLRLFAGCAGRLSALMEHQFLTDGPASERTRSQRDAMVDLLDAVTQPVDRGQALNWRVGAKAAHAALLAQALYTDDRRLAARATAQTAGCLAMLPAQS